MVSDVRRGEGFRDGGRVVGDRGARRLLDRVGFEARCRPATVADAHDGAHAFCGVRASVSMAHDWEEGSFKCTLCGEA